MRSRATNTDPVWDEPFRTCDVRHTQWQQKDESPCCNNCSAGLEHIRETYEFGPLVCDQCGTMDCISDSVYFRQQTVFPLELDLAAAQTRSPVLVRVPEVPKEYKLSNHAGRNPVSNHANRMAHVHERMQQARMLEPKVLEYHHNVLRAAYAVCLRKGTFGCTHTKSATESAPVRRLYQADIHALLRLIDEEESVQGSEKSSIYAELAKKNQEKYWMMGRTGEDGATKHQFFCNKYLEKWRSIRLIVCGQEGPQISDGDWGNIGALFLSLSITWETMVHSDFKDRRHFPNYNAVFRCCFEYFSIDYDPEEWAMPNSKEVVKKQMVYLRALFERTPSLDPEKSLRITLIYPPAEDRMTVIVAPIEATVIELEHEDPLPNRVPTVQTKIESYFSTRPPTVLPP